MNEGRETRQQKLLEEKAVGNLESAKSSGINSGSNPMMISSDDSEINPTNPINLMNIADDQLASMFRPLTLEHASLAYFAWVKLINRRMTNVIRNEMKNAVYQASLHALVFLVPGTLIPCGAITVLPVPVPTDWDETCRIFENNMQLAPNGVKVGGIFRYHSPFLQNQRSSTRSAMNLGCSCYWFRSITMVQKFTTVPWSQMAQMMSQTSIFFPTTFGLPWVIST